MGRGRRFVLWLSIAASATVASFGASASAEGPYVVPQVSRVAATISSSFLGGDVNGLCLLRSEVAGSVVQQRMMCYTSLEPAAAPSPPPPPYERASHFVVQGALDQSTGTLDVPFMQCTEILSGIVAAKVELSASLDKAGGPAQGFSAVTVDMSSPLDCANGIQTTGPLTLTPLAQSHDEDIWGAGPNDKGPDGCSDWEELGTSQVAGGLRDPFNFWDFYDVPTAPSYTRDKAVSAADFFAVLGRFNTSGNPAGNPLSPPPPSGYHTAYDRGVAAVGPNGWNLSPPDGAIAGGDSFAVLGQFNHSCQAAP